MTIKMSIAITNDVIAKVVNEHHADHLIECLNCDWYYCEHFTCNCGPDSIECSMCGHVGPPNCDCFHA